LVRNVVIPCAQLEPFSLRRARPLSAAADRPWRRACAWQRVDINDVTY